MKHFFPSLVLLLILLAGCATGEGDDAPDLSKYTAVCFVQTGPFDQAYIQPVAERFEKFGFEITLDPKRPNTIMCGITRVEDSSFAWHFTLVLAKGHKTLFKAEVQNPEFASGTDNRINNPAAMNELLDKLETALRKSRKPITPAAR